MIKLVIFDFDGTLFDTKKEVFSNLEKELPKIGIIMKTERDFEQFYKTNFYASLKARNVSKKKITLFKKMSAALRAKHAPYAKAFKGILPMLRQLKKSSRLAVISSSFSSSIKTSLRENKMLDYFDAVVGADKEENKVKKIKACMKKLKARPSETAYVGDTAGDVIEAKKAKVKSVAVSWGFHPRRLLEKEKPNYIAGKPDEILKVLKVKK